MGDSRTRRPHLQKPNLEDWVSLADLERSRQMSRATLRRFLEREGVPAVKIGNSRNATVRYRLSDVERAFSRWMTKPASPGGVLHRPPGAPDLPHGRNPQ